MTPSQIHELANVLDAFPQDTYVWRNCEKAAPVLRALADVVEAAEKASSALLTPDQWSGYRTSLLDALARVEALRP